MYGKTLKDREFSWKNLVRHEILDPELSQKNYGRKKKSL